MWSLWVAFIVFIVFLLALDLGVFHRKAHVIGLKEALMFSGLWIGVALVFNVFIYFAYEYHWFGLDVPEHEPDGRTAAILFLTGYMVEKSLGMDNVFVIAMIFSYFGIPVLYQHRVLFWGIVGALAMRAVMILAGVALIQRFHWILYVFGAFLIVSGVRMAMARHTPDPKKNPIIALARRLLPVTDNLVGERLAVRINGKLALTPLALALIMIESSDVIFAIDSIPAIFAITHDSFLIFTSNILAVLGLRSLYFALAGIIRRFYYLKLSLALLLALIGTKMLLADILHTLPGTTYYTLGAITLILAGGIVASIIRARRAPESYQVEIPVRRKLIHRKKPVSWAKARRRFLDEWGVLSFYERFEQAVALILANVIAVVVVISLFQIIRAVVVLLAGEAFNLLDHAVFQNLFGMIMTLLIAMEFKHSIIRVALRQDSIIRVKTVVLIALIALARKFVILDTATTEAAQIAALAVALLALGGVYWLLRERDDALVEQPAKLGPTEETRAQQNSFMAEGKNRHEP